MAYAVMAYVVVAYTVMACIVSTTCSSSMAFAAFLASSASRSTSDRATSTACDTWHFLWRSNHLFFWLLWGGGQHSFYRWPCGRASQPGAAKKKRTGASVPKNATPPKAKRPHRCVLRNPFFGGEGGVPLESSRPRPVISGYPACLCPALPTCRRRCRYGDLPGCSCATRRR